MPSPTGNYAIPDDPADPEAAALDLIVHFPTAVLGRPEDPVLTTILQDFAGALHAEDAFAGLVLDDAKLAVTAYGRPSCTRCDSWDHGPCFVSHRGVVGDLGGANVKVVQRMLGHASAAMTLDVYAIFSTTTSRELPRS
jgi:hypothetical protein